MLSWAPGEHCNSHHARHKTLRHLLFRVCVVVLSSITSRSVAAAAASSLMRLARAAAATRRILGFFRVIALLVFVSSCHCFVFPCSCASGAAHARSFCTHRCSRITESTVFKRTHHKDRRQLQLFRRLALHDRTASCVCARSRHICSVSFCLHVPTERHKYVWLVQSRRRPEKWIRTRKAGS